MENGFKSRVSGPLQGYDSNKPSKTPLKTHKNAGDVLQVPDIDCERCEILHYKAPVWFKGLFFFFTSVMCHRLNLNIPLLGPPVKLEQVSVCQCSVAGFSLPVPSRVSEALRKGVPVDLQLSDLAKTDTQTERHGVGGVEDGRVKPVTAS